MSSGRPVEPAAREIRALTPRPDLDGLRSSYLELLKLCLCDLTGVATREVRWTGDRRLFHRELIGEDQIDWRAQGKDWPLNGLTMVGLRRLDDLQACVESVVGDGVPGDLIEAGAWRGGASILIRATLDSLGAAERTLWVADSFAGFPVAEEQGVSADRELESHISDIGYLACPLEEVQRYFARFGCDRGVRFLAGFFEQTMAELGGLRWSLVRLDADTYSATRAALDSLYPGLAAGGYVIVDDYFHPYLSGSCRRAVDDFRSEQGITEPIEQIDWNGARWRRSTEPSPSSETAPSVAEPAIRSEAARAASQRSPVTIPSDRELELGDQVAALQARLRSTEAELEGLKRSRAVLAADWARRRLKRDRLGG
jgi:hypothetical protein